MAITVTSPAVRSSGWIYNGNSADASGGETLIAAPGAGKNFEIRQVTISSDSAISVTLLSAATILLGPVTFAAGQCIKWRFDDAMVTGTNEALNCDAGGAGNINIFCSGRTV